MNLYPLKFRPILKSKIWGGGALSRYGKAIPANENIGESWELSAQGDDISVVTNGFLADNDLNDLVEIYMGELVGDKVYEHFGNLFPLLFKFIDAEDNLSVQVHPNDEVALERHHSLGKTELWYVLDAEPQSSLILGFKEDIDADTLQDKLYTHTLQDVLQVVPVQRGNVAFIPSGLVHSLGKGVLVAEIQETSDITYRIYDYDRVDAAGNPRDLHIQEALDVINYSAHKSPLVTYQEKVNISTLLATSEHFTTNLLAVDQTIERDYTMLDSFVVYMCTEGACILHTNSDTLATVLQKGETVLIPASIGEVRLEPTTPTVKLLETYM